MFGYVIADLARLDEGQQTRYKSFYCGLCRTLGERYGLPARLALRPTLPRRLDLQLPCVWRL